ILAEVPKDLTTIHYAMMGAGGGDGALAQWHRVVGNDHRHGENGGNNYPYVVNSTFIDRLNDQFDYFQAVQLRGITLLVEARNFLKDSAGAQSDYNRFNGYLATQKAALYSLRVDSHVLISPLTGTMWDKTLLSDGTNPFFDGPASGSTPPVIPTAITSKLATLRTAGYSDWRLPTADELYKLGPLSASRSNDVLISEGFGLNDVTSLGYYILSSEYYGSDFWGLNHGGTVYLLNYYPNKVLVVPARTFRVDTLATLQ
ncbi:MAG TPA: hypothetical protein V6D05_15560, partial [Stenomitos sp.]